MWEGDRFVVRRSPFMLAFQIVAAFGFIFMGVYMLVWRVTPPTGEQTLLAWLVIAGSIAALFVLGQRALGPKVLLTIDANGLSWWKADRTILWAEIAQVRIDTYKTTFYLHVTLCPNAAGVGTDPAHPLEAFGSMLTQSDLSFRLSDASGARAPVKDALEQLAPERVRILRERE